MSAKILFKLILSEIVALESQRVNYRIAYLYPCKYGNYEVSRKKRKMVIEVVERSSVHGESSCRALKSPARFQREIRDPRTAVSIYRPLTRCVRGVRSWRIILLRRCVPLGIIVNLKVD